MAEPTLVAACVAAMADASALPVTVKCRIGIDDQDAEESLDRFIDRVAEAGCNTFIVHARKAWLKGLSPKENRDVPPLDYGRVVRLKQRLPDLEIVLNGGIESFTGALSHLPGFDGVMLGRAAYADPYLLAEVDRALFGATETPPSRSPAANAVTPFAARVGFVEKSRFIAAMNDPGTAGTSIGNENVASAPGATSLASGTDATFHVVLPVGAAEPRA